MASSFGRRTELCSQVKVRVIGNPRRTFMHLDQGPMKSPTLVSVPCSSHERCFPLSQDGAHAFSGAPEWSLEGDPMKKMNHVLLVAMACLTCAVFASSSVNASQPGARS